MYAPPPDSGLTPVHTDEHLLVVDKPGGLLSVPGRGEDKQDCMISRVQARFPDALTVHRLDMETSGLLVFARSIEVQRALSIAFAERRVEKAYIALVAGKLVEKSGTIDLPLITDWPNRPLQKVDSAIGKPSLTRYRLLEYDAALDHSRVLLEPHTGRSHQLRVHMCAIGHPIMGDRLYAPTDIRDKLPRLALHASLLRFQHPVTHEALEFRLPAPF